MNVFVDLGCYDGDSVEEFRNWSKLAFGEDKEWVIYAFDPNPNFGEQWRAKWQPNTNFVEEAAWIADCKMDFSVEDSKQPVGSTLMKTKNTWEKGEKIQVDAFDFSNWLKDFKDDFVVVKMDIEGAEFPVLHKMIMDGTHKIPDHLLVEFHPNKVTDYTTTDKNDLIEKLKAEDVHILEWH